VSCDRYFELLSARLDRELTREEAEEVELHLVGCPKCRRVGAQLAELREDFAGLEEVPAPEGFAQGVMDRIRAGDSRPKVIPLFQRPRFRALAGLAACLALAVGLYGAAQLKNNNAACDGVTPDALSEGVDAAAPQSRSAEHAEDAPQIAAYSDPGASLFKAAPPDALDSASGLPGPADMEPVSQEPVERFSDSAVLVLGRMPEGAEAFITDGPGAVSVSYNAATGEEGYNWWTEGAAEALAGLERLAQEQGITAERSSAPAEEALYDLVILEPAY